ncbi:hypothetical protein JCM3765_003417 [Sporobolomyces pararoseus]
MDNDTNMGLRYGTLVFHGIAFVLILSDIPQRICRKMFWLETFGLVYVLVTADALLSIRVWALWNNSRRALVALTGLLLADVAVLVAAACFVQALDIPRSIAVATDALGCVAVDSPGETRKLSALIFIAPFVTNWVLFIATVYRSAMITRKLEGTKLPVLRRLVSDGALYFACIVAANGLNVYFHVPTVRAEPSSPLAFSASTFTSSKPERVHSSETTNCYAQTPGAQRS